jgi:hypothetical protein
MRKILLIVAAVTVGVLAWRRNRRLGTRFVNAVVNPALVRRGLAGKGRSEIGTLEHVGRRSGVRRLTPVHPEPTTDGFRIVVPLGSESAWARNVLAAGHCRLQLHDVVYDLDEPRMVAPAELDGIPRLLRAAEGALGFQYLVLHRFGAAAGALDPVAVEAPEEFHVVAGHAAPAAVSPVPAAVD